MVKPIDIALLISFFGLHGAKVEGRTRIQKDICILKHKYGISFNFSFEPYYYGPYSTELADVLDTLVATGLLEQVVVYVGFDARRYDYVLTKEGNKIFHKIKEKLDKEQPVLSAELKKGVKTLEEMTIPEVVSIAKKCSGIPSIP